MSRVSQSVSYDEAKARVLRYFEDNSDALGLPIKASAIGAAVWPGSDMKAQGLGGAASRILHRMQTDGLVRWVCIGRNGLTMWGWVKERKIHEQKQI